MKPITTFAGALLFSAVPLSMASAEDPSPSSEPVLVFDAPEARIESVAERSRPLPRTELAAAGRNDERHRPAWLRGVYLEARAGASFLADADNEGGSLNGSEVDFDTGYTLGGAVGYSLADAGLFSRNQWNNIRVEFEGFFSRNNIDSVTTGAALFNDLDAEATASGGLFNVFYDFDLGRMAGPRFSRWKPYIGAGVGGAVLDVDDAGLRDDADTVLAWQARAGLGYELTRRTTVSLGYRFFDTQDPDLRAGDGGAFESEYRSHAVEVGLRYRF